VEQTTVVDGLGQKLELDIENLRGGGGQRRISIFCRYWIINTTEHSLRYRQENSKVFVSGTVSSPEKNGSLPMSGGRAKAKYCDFSGVRRSSELRTIFSGTPGALASRSGLCALPPEEIAPLLDKELSLQTITRLAFMFNFHDGAVLTIGHQKLSVQLHDGTGSTSYESDWSRGFSLNSVGISETIRYVIYWYNRVLIRTHPNETFARILTACTVRTGVLWRLLLLSTLLLDFFPVTPRL
jgi:SHR-binding domain of vacuolar-sorting associated protein 13